MTVSCRCGAIHTDISRLQKVGWQPVGEGEFVELVNCTCKSTIAASFLTDAAQCSTCKRVITGKTDDPHVHIVDPTAGALVLCRPCFQRDARRATWLDRKKFS